MVGFTAAGNKYSSMMDVNIRNIYLKLKAYEPFLISIPFIGLPDTNKHIPVIGYEIQSPIHMIGFGSRFFQIKSANNKHVVSIIYWCTSNLQHLWPQPWCLFLGMVKFPKTYKLSQNIARYLDHCDLFLGLTNLQLPFQKVVGDLLVRNQKYMLKSPGAGYTV